MCIRLCLSTLVKPVLATTNRRQQDLDPYFLKREASSQNGRCLWKSFNTVRGRSGCVQYMCFFRVLPHSPCFVDECRATRGPIFFDGDMHEASQGHINTRAKKLTRDPIASNPTTFDHRMGPEASRLGASKLNTVCSRFKTDSMKRLLLLLIDYGLFMNIRWSPQHRF